MNTTLRNTALALATLATVAGCAGGRPSAEQQAAYDRDTAEVMARSFREQGIVKTDRLQQDEVMTACSKHGHHIDDDLRDRIQEGAMAAIKWPSDGNYLGDWKEGEKIAQSGRGLTWSDKAGDANGGNCYNCHRITKKEISFGTIGPSLYQYGKLHGNTEATQKYVWGKIWNPNAYTACTNMPRFGAHAILDEKQIRHIVALLLDPKSPVNAE
ncbi:sulfur oxidation c-type cytochrome SoxX [Methyloversatilis sp.]|uniref:sulfur oxidation c-type cytochrome SoxX n=1 Tax=Methyloversatilis sp. TaxID=2569862 RepID=UPI003D2D69A4